MATLAHDQSDLLDISGTVYSSQAVALTGGGYMVSVHVLDYAGGGAGQYGVGEVFDASGQLTKTFHFTGAQGGGADAIATALPGDRFAAVVEGPTPMLEEFSASGTQMWTSPVVTNSGVYDAGGVAALNGAGLVVTFDAQHGGFFAPTYNQLLFRRYDASGNRNGDPVAITASETGISDAASVASLSSGGFVATWWRNSVGLAQIYDANGVAAGGQITLGAVVTAPYGGAYRAALPTAAGLSNGGFVAEWQAADGVHLQHYSATGVSLGAPVLIAGAIEHNDAAFGSAAQTLPAVAALPDGGYVATWIQTNADGSTQIMGERVDATDQPVGAAFAVSNANTDIKGPASVAVGPNGTAFFSWTDSVREPDSHGSAMGRLMDFAPVAARSGEYLVSAGPAVELTASAGWTSAAVLETHALAVVSAQASDYGSHVGAEQTYDAAGSQTGSAQLMGYAGAGQTLNPQITALGVGGFYEVTYPQSTNYEIYNTFGQAVFVHNAYTSATAAFAGLVNGGYVVTDSAANVFGLFDSHANNLGWISLPSDAPGAPNVNAVGGGGFVFTYSGTSHFDTFDAAGTLTTHGELGAAASSFTTAFAALPGAGAGWTQSWLSPDGGQFGLATSLDIQLMGPQGAITQAITVAQDLDPWHTTIQLQTHQDGSIAILWSQGGGIFGAEYAGGVVSAPVAAVAGDLSQTRSIQLSDGEVGLAWLQGGHAWAELFNPATGVVERADLGAATGDVSTVHALATANGGMAISWHDAAGIESAVLDDAGHVGSSVRLPGDLLGVDSAGHAVTLHDQSGTPVLQAFALSDGLFWVH